MTARSLMPLWAALVGCGSPSDPKAGAAVVSTAPADTSTDSAPPDSGAPPTAVCAGRGTPISSLSAAGCLSEAACSRTGEVSYEYFGYALAGGEDFDGDGVEDVVAGALFSDDDRAGATVYDVGRAVIWSGADLAAGGAGAERSVRGTTENEQAGASVALIGDIDGDGDSELLLGARNFGVVGAPTQGAVHLILGTNDPEPSIHRTWTGTQAYGRAGHAVSTPGDMDGDGIPELTISGALWAAGEEEDTEVFSSGTVFLTSGAELPESGALSTFPVQLTGPGSTDQAGTALAGGDLDQDGYADLMVGAPYGATSRGAVFVVPGGPTATSPMITTLDTVAGTVLEGTATGDAFGWALAVGDVTGDGRPDLAVGAPLHDAPWGAEGEVRVFAGDDTEGLTVVARFTGEHDDHQLGTGLVAGPDFDGDGNGDLVVGAVAAWHGLRPKSGRTYILSGGPGLSGDTPIAHARQLHAPDTKDYLGRAAAVSDIDRDGHPDLIVGTPYANPDGRTDAGGVWLFFGG